MNSKRAPHNYSGCLVSLALIYVGMMFTEAVRAVNGTPWVLSGAVLIIIGIVLSIPHLRAEVRKRAMLRSESQAGRSRRGNGTRPLQ